MELREEATEQDARDIVEIMQQSICDAMMDEMGKDKVGSIDWFLMSRWLISKASATP